MQIGLLHTLTYTSKLTMRVGIKEILIGTTSSDISTERYVLLMQVLLKCCYI
jgi:hypothetical protein